MKDKALDIEWSEISPIPAPSGAEKQFGLASPYAGITDGVVVVTGGANFPDVPIAQGGKKKYHDDIFVLEDGEWRTAGKFAEPAAYGAAVSTSDGILCIGGRTYSGPMSDVFIMRWNPENQSVYTERYPSLPKAMENFGAALVGSTVYAVGGCTDGAEANTFVSLDLSKKGTADFVWTELPSFPGAARVQPVVAAQSDGEEGCFFLIGGSCYPESSEMPVMCNDVLKYSPRHKAWTRLSAIRPDKGAPRLLRGACGAAVKENRIVCVGGVNEEVFSTAVHQERNGGLPKDYFLHDPEWFRFSKEVLVYDTFTDSWSLSEEFPFRGPAGAAMVSQGDSLLVINGEMMPGIRTDKVYSGIVKQH